MQTLTRRHAIATTGAGIIAGLSTTPRPAAAAEADTSLASLVALLDRHAAAYEADSALWSAVGELSETMPDLPKCRVAIAYSLVGRDAAGNDIRHPIYVHSREAIETHYRRRADEQVWFAARDNPPIAARIRERANVQMQAKIDELATIEAEHQRAEAEHGLTAVTDKARAAGDVVKAIEAEILAFVPGSLAAASCLAAWVRERFMDDRAYLTDDDLLVALASIGKAVQS